jgi:hypothetical protein
MMRALHVAAICAALMLGACSDHPQPPGDPLDPDPPGAEPVVLVGAGDIAACNSDGDEATAKLLDEIDGTVITLGDNAYPDGRASDFSQCYEPSWGRHLSRTRPTPGNHDYHSSGAVPYFAYFGARAGPAGEGSSPLHFGLLAPASVHLGVGARTRYKHAVPVRHPVRGWSGRSPERA